MTDTAFASAIALAAGAMVLAAVLIVWRRDLGSIIRLLAWQGAALAMIPVIRGVYESDGALMVIGAAIAVLRTALLPWLLARALGAERRGLRDAEPFVNTTAALLIAAALTVVAFAVTRPVVDLDPGPTTAAVPAAFAVVLIALFTMATRRHAISQAAGFLMLDNGIAAAAFLLTAGVPVIVELGASLDVMFVVIVIGVLTGRMRRKFGAADLDALQELRD